MKKKYYLNANIVDPANNIDEIGGIIIDENGHIKEGFGIFTSDKFEEILYNNYK